MRFSIRSALAASVLLAAPSCGLTLLSPEQEVAMGLQSYPQATGEHREVTSGRDHDMVQRAMRRLVPYAERDVRAWYGKSFEWEVKLLEAPKVLNAWCLPGGKMAFYSGILPICQNEAGVAAVMSHEIAHAVLRHGNQRISQNLLLKGLIVAGAVALGGDELDDQERLILAGLGLGVQYGIALPFSRSHESEADAYGVELMVQAGYDPWEAVRLWERMAARGGSGTPEFLSTHPSPENRAEALEGLIPKVLAKYGKS